MSRAIQTAAKRLLYSTRCLKNFAALNRDGVLPDSEPAKITVEKLQQCITDNFYTCTDDILKGLGQMYVADERFRKNIDKHGEGTAAYASACIQQYFQA